jgi:predicted component of type VI protein secretion system
LISSAIATAPSAAKRRGGRVNQSAPQALTKGQQNQPVIVNALLSVVVYFVLHWRSMKALEGFA